MDAPYLRSCEQITNLSQRRQGAKERKEELPCFLCVLSGFAPWRETVLLSSGFFHTFLSKVGAELPVEAESIYEKRLKIRPLAAGVHPTHHCWYPDCF